MDKKLKMELIYLWASIWVFGMVTAEAGAFQSISVVSFLALIFADAGAAAMIVMRISAIIKLVATKGAE